MDIYICGGKQTQSGKTLYLLKDVRNNREVTVTGDELKNAMRNKKVDVMNLTLTSDNRLVEASRDKIAQLSGLLNAPYSLRGYLDPLNPEYMNDVENIMDEIIKDSIEAYVKDCKKYVKISSINKENNTFVLEFTLGLNSYVMCHYDKIVYGEINQKASEKTKSVYGHLVSSMYNQEIGAICFDIGIQVLAISNKRASSKVGDGSILKASEAINTKGCHGDAIRLQYKTDSNNKLVWDDEDIDRLKESLGKFILTKVANELTTTCENNPDIANNTNVRDYIKYDNLKSDYIRTTAKVAGATLGGTLVITAVVAVAVSVSPDVLQTGLLAKIAEVGTTSQIFNAITAYSAGSGLLVGGVVTGKAIVDSGINKSLQRDRAELREAKEAKNRDWMGILGKKK